MTDRRKPKNKSIKLALYFGLIFVFIFIISVIFKGVDLIRESNFDGKDKFTVAAISLKDTDIVSVSPQDKTLYKITIKNSNSKEDLTPYLIPIDAYVYLESYDAQNAKSLFPKMLSGLKNSKTNVTIIDLLRLSFFARSLNSESIKEDVVDLDNKDELQKIAIQFFKDPKIEKEGVNIQVTNSSEISGIGNRLGDFITNMGGNVVLVNSSQKKEKKSKLLYSKKSYTVKKLSDILNLPMEEKELSTISDIVIIIGEDGQEVINL